MVDDAVTSQARLSWRTAFIKKSLLVSLVQYDASETLLILALSLISGRVCVHTHDHSHSRLNTHARTDGYKRSSYYSLQRTQMQNVHKYAFMQMNIHVEIFPGYSGCNARCGIAIERYTS